MKPTFFILTFLAFTVNAVAQQYAIINDKDVFVNIRKGPNLNSPIVGKIANDHIFMFYSKTNTDWPQVFIQNSENKNDLTTGYIHRSRIFPITNFSHIKGKKVNGDKARAANDSVQVIITQSAFIPAKHPLTYQTNSGNFPSKQLIKIDSKQFWGTDGQIPKKAISAVIILKKGQRIVLLKEAFIDLYEPQLQSLNVYFGRNNTMYIEMENSDGAGAYVVIWTIINDVYTRRYVSASD